MPRVGWGPTTCDEIIVCDTAPDPGPGEEWPPDRDPPAEDDPDSDDSGCTTCGAGGDGSGDDDSSDEEFCISETGKKVPCELLDPNKPCAGNPVKNPRIAEQTYSGMDGGRFGYTRSDGSQFHSGIDLINEIGNPFYAMYDGRVVGRGYKPDKLGYYIKIQVNIDGQYYLLQFGHLKENGRPANDSSIRAGDIIGYQGLSGNLQEAILEGSTNQPHSHFSAKEKLPNNDWGHKTGFGDPINPEQIMTTKFDEQGNPITGTDC